MMLFEVDQAANRIRAEVDPDANIIFRRHDPGEYGGSPPRVGGGDGHRGRTDGATAAKCGAAASAGARGMAQPIVKPEPKAAASPVHSRVEALAQEMNATMAVAAQPAPIQAAPAYEPAVHRKPEPLVIEEELEPIQEPIRIQPAAAQRAAPQVQPQRAGLFGLFGGRRKTEAPRAEPQMTPAAPPFAGRATAEPLTRSARSPTEHDAGQSRRSLRRPQKGRFRNSGLPPPAVELIASVKARGEPSGFSAR